VEIRLLGPVEICAGAGVHPVGGQQKALLLAVLAVHADRPVSAEALIGRLWDGEAAGTRAMLHVLVSRVRRVLADRRTGARVERGAGGYRIRIDPTAVDVHRFGALVEQSRAPGIDPVRRAGLLTEALRLWRGEPLAGLPGHWAARTREAWRREYLDAVVGWGPGRAGARQRPGAARPAHHPGGGEPAGRGADRGPDPGPGGGRPAAGRPGAVLGPAGRAGRGARRRAGSFTAGVAAGRAAPRAAARSGGRPPRPPRSRRRRPPGRCRRLSPARSRRSCRPTWPASSAAGEQLSRLDALLDAGSGTAAGVVISALSGTAGMGKTALAVHWGHRIRDRFPDGQLYVNLRGFDAGGQRLAPSTALRGFLDALGVPPQRLPAEPAAQAAL